MGVAISILTFILGFFANKILEYVTDSIKKRLKRKSLEKSLDNFYTNPHRDVVITASGFPFFVPENIKESISKENTLLLAKPNGKNSSDKSFAESDHVTNDFSRFITENSLQEQLEKVRLEVFESFTNRDKGNFFNGSILGVNHLDGLARTTDAKEAPVLSIDFYKTDYYTHKIIEQLLDSASFDRNSLISELNNSLSWTRTSFGVSVIIIIPKQNEIILTKRSNKAAYTEGKEWLYVSVTETLSETDYNDETGCPDVIKCVWRGISEELGISERQLKKDTLRFYESFYETHFHQDNIVASIEISESMTFSDIYSLLAKDKYMEVSDIITIPNDKSKIINFIDKNKNDMRSQTIFSLESFVARM